MNEWTKKTKGKVESEDYLDQLFKIYSISPNERTPLKKSDKTEIQNSLTNGDSKNLLKKIIELSKNDYKFPIDDSYIGFLRAYPESIELNPKTIQRISSHLNDLGFAEIIKRMEAPKASSRQLGQSFKNYIKNNKFLTKENDFDKFFNSKTDVVFYGSDRRMKEFANKYLGYKGKKGIDFLAKYNGVFVVGEAKFITNVGGTQNEAFKDVKTLLRCRLGTSMVPSSKIKTIGIVDGVPYLKNDSQNYKYLQRSNKDIFSALFLVDYLNSL